MSLTTWTPAAIASKAAFLSETICRLVVKNSRTSISKITDTDDELILVGREISHHVTTLDKEFRDLHPLMQLPFKAKAYQGGSRFRAQFDSGDFYGADTIETAAAERGYHHHLFVKSSPELLSSGATPFTFFTIKIAMKLVERNCSVCSSKKSSATEKLRGGFQTETLQDDRTNGRASQLPRRLG